MPEVRGLFCNNESLPSLPPAYPAFSFASAPIPPPPFPAGRGETISFFAGGSAPGAPGIRPFTALTAPAAVVPRRGACPLGRLPTLPVACFSAPSPDPLPLRGRGRFLVFLCKGLRPLHPGVWTGRGTGSASIGDTRRWGLRLGRRLALPPLHPAGWGKQSGDPEDPPRGGSAAGCRQIVAC